MSQPKLSELLNILQEWEFEGQVWRVRPPNQIEQGLFSRWLERRDREHAARATELDEADQEKLLRFSGINSATGVYDYGTDAYCAALLTPRGFAQMLFYTLRAENADKAVTEDLTIRMVVDHIAQLAIILQAASETDEEVKKNLLRSVGLPPDYLDSNDSPSGDSPAPPSEAPETSKPSDG